MGKRINKKNILSENIFIILFLITLFIIITYEIFQGTNYIDSDMASEMVMAKQLNEEGVLISKNWYYGTELRVLCEPSLYKFTLLLFPKNWHAARVLGKAISLLILGLSFVYLGRSLNINKAGRWLGATVLILPFGFWHAFHSILGCFYAAHMIYVCLILGLVVDSSKNKNPIKYILLAVIGVIAGLGGIRIIIMLSVPLILSSLYLYMKEVSQEKHFFSRDSLCLSLLVSVAIEMISTGVGYVINSMILYKVYHIGELEKNWTSLDINAIIKTWSWFLGNLGYPVIEGFNIAIPVLSFLGIVCGLIGIILAVFFVICLIRIVKRREEFDVYSRILITTFLIGLIFDGIVFASMSGVGGGNGSYWLPVLPLAVSIVILELASEKFIYKHTRKLISAGIILLLVFTSVGTLRMIKISNIRHPQGIEEVASWLHNKGITQGYTTFWNGNVLTELTNGEIEAWVVEDLSTMKIYHFLQNTSHASEKPDGKYFVLTKDESERKEYDKEAKYEDRIAYQDDNGFTIYVFVK